MKKERGIFAMGLSLGLIAGIVLGIVVGSKVTSVQLWRKTGIPPENMFSRGGVLIGVKIETISEEVKQTAQGITEAFVYQLAGAVMMDEEEGALNYLMIISKSLAEAAKKGIKMIQQSHPETKLPRKKKIQIFS